MKRRNAEASKSRNIETSKGRHVAGSSAQPGIRNAAALLCVVTFILFAQAPARGAEVALTVSPRETYVGTPVTVDLTIENGDNVDPPVFPKLNGARVTGPQGPFRSSQTMIVNNQISQKNTLRYRWVVTPQTPGRLNIPPFKVKADGKTYATRQTVILVSAADSSDVLLAAVTGSRETVYVGESLTVVLQIWIKPYLDRQLQVQLDEADMWSLVDFQGSEWGVFVDALRLMMARRDRPIGREVIRKDAQGEERAYFQYELATETWAQKPGEFDPGQVRVRMRYPTKLSRDNSFFSMGGLQIAGSRWVEAAVNAAPIRIKPIPAEGRPPDFRGAVGQFKIEASAAPLEAAVGDPITLSLNVAGTGRLEVLQAPPLHELPELTRDFKVPADPLAGEVAGKHKRFTQSIRPDHEGVTQIPPIPFTYFDPLAEKFVTVRSQPIPIRVRAAARMADSMIVEAAGGRAGAVTQLTELSGGILANCTGIDELLTSQDFAPGWPTALGLALPPFAFAACWLTQRRRERLR
ncbi:MAG: BatD family protein, partial [Phycisphaerae bacterium]|nr:BatD family protein [Phycisphaerae bacterium]